MEMISVLLRTFRAIGRLPAGMAFGLVGYVFGFQGLSVDTEALLETDTEITVRVRSVRDEPLICPRCANPTVCEVGTRLIRYRDIPARGKSVTVEWEQTKYVCLETYPGANSCRQTFFDEHQQLPSAALMTTRLFDWIGRRCLADKFDEVARDVGLDAKTIASVFAKWIEERTAQRGEPVSPSVLAIDKIRLAGKLRTVLANVDEATLLDLLPDRKSGTIAARIEAFKDRETVQVVSMDMCLAQRAVVRSHLPSAKIVVDRLHVMRMANDAVTVAQMLSVPRLGRKLRRLLPDRERRPDEHLEKALAAECPLLGKALATRAALGRVYECSSMLEARRAYAKWLDGVTGDLEQLFHPLICAVDCWNNEVFSYFECARLGSTYLSALEGFVGALGRNARRRPFDCVRAEVMVGFRQAIKNEGCEPGRTQATDPNSGSSKFVGLDLAKLASCIEPG
jgi:transposase